MMHLLKYLIDTILPPRCLVCGKIVLSPHSLCEECFQKVDFITTPYCKICGMPFENQSQAVANFVCPDCLSHKHITRLNRSAVLYNDCVQNMVLAFKFADKTLFSKLFAKWMLPAFSDIQKQGIDVIIPVPLSYKRLIKRRYNQATLLAKEFSKLTHIETDLYNLIKVRHTKPQAQMHGHARLKNIKNAYQIKYPKRIKGKRILLIDDVMTTGATLTECAKTLIKAGAKSVDTLTFARVKKN